MVILGGLAGLGPSGNCIGDGPAMRDHAGDSHLVLAGGLTALKIISIVRTDT